MSIPQPAEPCADDLLLTAEQLADRWQCDVATLQNARSKGEGCPYIKVTGGVRYRLQDIVTFERAKTKGFTWPKLAAALEDFPKLSRLDKQELLLHLKARMR